MSKGVLRFNLPEEQHEFKYASNAMGLVRTLSEIQTFIRNKLKNESPDPRMAKMLEDLKQVMKEALDENGFSYWLDE
jgi:hypothetical protein